MEEGEENQEMNGVNVSEMKLTAEECDPTCVTYIFRDEDHTIGNALRYVLNLNPEVEFVGYTIPHPLENKMHLRIQTRNVTARKVLEEALSELDSMCSSIRDVFDEAVDHFDSNLETT